MSVCGANEKKTDCIFKRIKEYWTHTTEMYTAQEKQQNNPFSERL